MAVSYTTNLTMIDGASTAVWLELTGATAGLASVVDTDFFIEGTGTTAACISKPFATAGLGSMAFNNASGIAISTGNASFHWLYFGAPNAIATLAAGGYRVAIGSDMLNYKMWYVLGSDTYAYGGWQNIAVDPTVSESAVYGAPSASTSVFGSVVNLVNVISKGNPYANDIIRQGRILQITGGSTDAYATFFGASSTNDIVTGNRWGLFQAIAGGYLQKGLFLMGTSTAATDFRDTNRNIFIQDTTKVTSGFNEFEVRNSTSRVDWTGIQITALGTISKGKFTTTNDADVNLATCTFTDMNTFGFLSTATILTTTFRRCGIVTQGGATFTSCKFDNATATTALIVNNIAAVTSTGFISDGTGYAIEGISTAGSYGLSYLNFTNYAVVNGITGNEAIHVLATTGTVEFGITGGNTPSIHTEGATVTFPSSVTLTMTVKDSAATAIANAYAFIDEATPSTPFIMNTITNSSGIATAVWTGGTVSTSTWRVRKYGYKDFKQGIDIGVSDISLPVTLVTDPQQV